ncbi:MAG TPA: transglutaminase domain-containing protein, partial [Terriglobales bacterium]|jgi:transglutaminase-like putative cysteine protease
LSDGRFDLEAPGLPSSRTPRPPRLKPHPIHYRVLLEPLGTNVFFLAPRAQAVEGTYQIVTSDQEGAIYNLDRERQLGLYEADSDVAQPAAADLRQAAGEFNPELLRRYLQLPPLDTRIPALARQLTSDAATNYDKAAAIELYLKRNYGYTLDLGRVPPKDPLAAFLFERKQGHCEYFASSMAVMLRTIGISARIVNGFRTGEFNDVNSQYLVRSRNAHSWVEAYFPGYGWISFDPTPPALPQPQTRWSRTLLYLDAAASFWREWVINYDFGHQRTLGQGAVHGTRSIVDRLRDRYTALLDLTRRLSLRLARSPRAWTVSGILAVVLLFLGIKVPRILAYLRSQRIAAQPERAPQTAAAIWYQRMTRVAARRGWPKSHAQTPLEFISSIQDVRLRESVGRFTEGYRKARFGNSTEDAKRLPQLYEEISALGRG